MASEVLFIMIQQAPASELRQLEIVRVRLDNRLARIGMAMMETYPIEDQPNFVIAKLNDIDDLL